MTLNGAHPVKVTACDPRLNAMHTYAPPPPGFYPLGGPYFWNDVYGYRYYQPPIRSTNPTLSIDYSNATDTAMKEIEFGLIANGRLVAEVRDVGTFSPGITIKHEFGLNRNVFPLQTGLPQCVPLHITFADGTKWKNPHLPALRRAIYESP
jgi:hypothetical protein